MCTAVQNCVLAKQHDISEEESTQMTLVTAVSSKH